MQLKELYFIAFQEYPHDVCLGLCAAHAIHSSMRVTKKDLAQPGRFDARLEKRIRKALHEETELELIIKLCFAVYEVETSHSLQGLGGCTAKSFKEVLDSNVAKK